MMPRTTLIDQDKALDRLGMLPDRNDFAPGPEGDEAYKKKLYRERAKLAGMIKPAILPGVEAKKYNAAHVDRLIAEAERAAA